MNYEMIRNMPTSRNGKMVYGLFAAFAARNMVNEAITMMPDDTDGAAALFIAATALVCVLVLTIVRYDTGRPLFEPLKVSK